MRCRPARRASDRLRRGTGRWTCCCSSRSTPASPPTCTQPASLRRVVDTGGGGGRRACGLLHSRRLSRAAGSAPGLPVCACARVRACVCSCVSPRRRAALGPRPHRRCRADSPLGRAACSWTPDCALRSLRHVGLRLLDVQPSVAALTLTALTGDGLEQARRPKARRERGTHGVLTGCSRGTHAGGHQRCRAGSDVWCVTGIGAFTRGRACVVVGAVARQACAHGFF
jgi:hypothetical protein